MKRLSVIIVAICISFISRADGYHDHRGHNIDSLERVVAPWTPQMIDSSSDEQLSDLINAWRELMLGNLQINPVKAEYYARRTLNLATKKRWSHSEWDACKVIGQTFWQNEQYDSATFYFKRALAAVERMAAGETNFMNPEGYDKETIDDDLSSLYGAIGNLYSIQDSVETAMRYYEMAGEIFKEHGWLTSCSVLYYNMGETWGAADDLVTAKQCYETALDYAHQSNDSLWVAESLKGLGALYLTKGRTAKALKYLSEADKYYSIHEDEELSARLETVDYIGQVLSLQKKSLKMVILSIIFIVALFGVIAYVVMRLRKAKVEKEEVAEFIEETIAEAPKQIDFKLNDREIAILKMLSEGKETSAMADILCLSPETIKWYRKRLLSKFDVTSSAALVSEALKRGII